MAGFNGNNSNRPQRKKNALDDQKLKLYTKNSEGKNASLMINIYDNNPRIVVYNGIEAERDQGAISARINASVAIAITNMIEQACAFRPTEEKPEIKFKIENKRPNFKPGGGKPEGLVNDTEILVGKDAKGRVWITVTKYKRTAIKFCFGTDEFHVFYHGTGEQLSEGEVSVMFARAWVKLIQAMIPHLLITEYKEPEPREFNNRNGGGNGGNRGGGYQGGGNRGGESTKPAGGGFDNFEEDLPY